MSSNAAVTYGSAILALSHHSGSVYKVKGSPDVKTFHGVRFTARHSATATIKYMLTASQGFRKVNSSDFLQVY